MKSYGVYSIQTKPLCTNFALSNLFLSILQIEIGLDFLKGGVGVGHRCSA